ncbi:MAG: hypothetical protein RSC13_04380 [Clostridium sp.]
MSLILCRQEPCKHPYYIERLGLHISSSQELCYVLYNNPLLIMDGFINNPLIYFIREELAMPFLAGKLETWKKSGEDTDEMIFIILQECCYYTSKEITKFRQLISAYRRMSPPEFTKETADYYFSLKQYGTAVTYYEKILDDWRLKSLSDEFTAKVWNNIGAAYAGIFWFEKALSAYDMSYNFKKSLDTLKRIYQISLLNPELSLKERYRTLITDSQKENWAKELQETKEKAKEQNTVKEVEELFNKDSIKRITGAGELLGKWKQEYRKMI